METRVTLEAFTEADFDRLISWVPSAEFLLQWGGSAFTFPLDREQLARYLAAAQQEPPKSLIFRARERESARVVGHVELSAIDERNQSARLSRVLVAPELRNRGYGKRLVREALSVAFDTLRLHRVELSVFTFNSVAIACYEQVGFQHEGVLREARKHESGFWSLGVMSILEQERMG